MKWGIMSTGTIARKFASTINQMEGEELVAISSRNLDKAIEFKNEFNILNAYSSYEDMCKDENVDVIYIATPNSMHYENALMCLKHNKHVLCEKPFTINPSEASYLYEYAKNNNLFIMEALWTYFLPSYKKIRELIENGDIGNIKSLSVNYGFDTNDDRKKRKFSSSLGGGALLDIGIYNIAFLYNALNIMPISFTSDVKYSSEGTDEYSEIIFNYENNIVAKSVCAIGKVIDREAYIEGDKGTIYLPDFQNAREFILNKNGESIKYSYPFEINGFEYQIREAEACILNKKSSSSIYSSNTSISLMKELYDIRKSWNMKFNFE